MLCRKRIAVGVGDLRLPGGSPVFQAGGVADGAVHVGSASVRDVRAVLARSDRIFLFLVRSLIPVFIFSSHLVSFGRVKDQNSLPRTISERLNASSLFHTIRILTIAAVVKDLATGRIDGALGYMGNVMD